MPLFFRQSCDLLEDLQGIVRHDPPFLPTVFQHKYKKAITSWFRSHGISIFSPKIDPTVLLSTLFPAKRTDRVYGIQPKRLTLQLSRYLRLGHGRCQQLGKYLQPGFGDLGDCVERVQRQAENPLQPGSCEVTLQEVDDALASLAQCNQFSDRGTTRLVPDNHRDAVTRLSYIFQRLQSREIKWLTRLLLKDLSIDLSDYHELVSSCIDLRLPVALRIFDNFESAVAELRLLPRPSTDICSHGDLFRSTHANKDVLVPKVGVKVGSPGWVKAKGGLKHAVTLANRKAMTLERKYDGEYCQIHVDLEKMPDHMKIFSKSGRNSTEDRQAILPLIERSLRIKQDDRKFNSKCILEGELLVWSDRDNSIMDFHKIRKHVARSGVFIGTEEDSQPQPYEHLMIVLFDLLLIDNDPVLYRQQRDRRWHLEQLVSPISGRVGFAEHIQADMRSKEGSSTLERFFAHALAHRWEGIVIKPLTDPYFECNPTSGPQGRWIKLKKDCIAGYGDSADMAVVGAGYDVRRAQDLHISNLKYTHFFVGALTNKYAVVHMGALPDFVVVDCVTNCIARDDFVSLNQRGVFEAMDANSDDVSNYLCIDSVFMDPQLPKMQTVFKTPFVFDIAGSGFEKGSNRSIFTLRFPRVLKIRWDVDWHQCIDLPELQSMAHEARNPSEEDLVAWRARLNAGETAMTPPRSVSISKEVGIMSTCPTSPETSIKNSLVKPGHQGKNRKATQAIFVREDTAEFEGDQQRSSTHPTEISENLQNSLPKPTRSIGLLNGGKRKRGSIHSEIRIEGCAGSQREVVRTTQEISPLQEVRNPPGATVSRDTIESTTIWTKDQGALSLVSKTTAEPNIPLYPRSKKQRRRPNWSPQSRETTSDECSSAASTQLRSLFATASQPVPSRSKTSPRKFDLQTTPDTDASFGVPKLPSLQNSMIFIEKNRRPLSKRFSRFYRANRAVLRPLLRSFRAPDSLPAQSGTDAREELTFLLDSRNQKAATQDLLEINSKGPLLQGRKVLVWDWRVLELMLGRSRIDGSSNDRIKGKRIQALFVAEIAFEAEEDLNDSSAVTIKWRGGDVDAVSEESILTYHMDSANA